MDTLLRHLVAQGAAALLLTAAALTLAGAAFGGVSSEGQANRLADEKSPYLLQHARNPVDWYPWGPEALDRARADDKPVFLSIGYSTCHWCHVMERESFEDGEVAALMNEHFVCIKVDREERPDIDGVYMDAAILMSGRGGWPLTILMTPDGKPFYAATYLPKESRFGMPGMMELLPRVAELWRDERGELLRTAGRVEAALADGRRGASAGGAGDAGSASPGERDIAAAERELAARFDPRHGGFGTAPKFPSPHNVLFLLRRWHGHGDARTLAMAESTLKAMRRGGVFDHVGFGFHRYSTDERWLLPHFEKMLYDQAMLTLAYTECALATGDDEYERTAREILEYVLRDMTAPSGAFCSAEDADSEGVEGKFYVWTADELREVLGADDARLAAAAFGVSDEGNVEDEATRTRTGVNVLHLPRPVDEVAREEGIPEDELRSRLDSARRRLFAEREKRVRPHLDDKVLTDWNGLMVSALATAGRAFDDPSFVDAARAAADFLLVTMRDGRGRLLHRFRDGDAAIAAIADDYAFLVAGLLDLYEATFEARYLAEAAKLNDEFVDRYWDDEAGGFYFTADDAERLLVRRKEVYDGAIPSGNSIAMRNLVRLSRMTGDAAHESRAERLARAFAADVVESPSAYTMLLSSLDHALAPTREVVVAGSRDAADTREMLRSLAGAYDPGRSVLLRTDDGGELARVAPWTTDLAPVDGRATAYVCRSRHCDLPTTSVDEMLDQLARR
ncbi:MAG: thioredoxin domain-containing protein [Candidatus Eisenbacteria bacterium]